MYPHNPYHIPTISMGPTKARAKEAWAPFWAFTAVSIALTGPIGIVSSLLSAPACGVLVASAKRRNEKERKKFYDNLRRIQGGL